MNKKITFISILLLMIGLAGTINIILHGEHAMGTSNGVPWGSLIAGYEFFVGISTGLLMVAALGYVFHIKAFLPMGKNAVLLAIFTMLSGFAILFVELGNVFHMFYYFITPNFGSPIWWMAPLYSIYLIMLVFLIYHIYKENQYKIKIFAALSFIAAVISLANIGFLFGFLQARPFWYGPLSPIYFVVSAFFSGIAVLTFTTYLGHEDNSPLDEAIPVYRKVLIASILVVAFIYIGKLMTGLHLEGTEKYAAFKALVAGPLSFNFYLFEVLAGIIIPLFLLLSPKPRNLGLAGIFATIGIFFMRLDMVIAGQIYPLKIVYGGVEKAAYYPYTPSWAEWAIILGGIGLSLLLYQFRNGVEVKVKNFGSKTISS